MLVVRALSAENPLASWILRVLRDEETPSPTFRRFLKIAGILLATEAAKFLRWRSVKVRTPLKSEVKELEPEKDPLIVAVLGAAIPLAEGMLEVFPNSPLGLVAARRIEEGEDIRVEVYYERLPRDLSDTPVIVTDPMLAIGLTLSKVIEILKERGARRILVATVIAARDGLKRIGELHGDVTVITLAIDPKLNSKYFIVPGLGDAGDRALGVEP